MGCGLAAGWPEGDLRDLTACLRSTGDRLAAKGAHDAARKRIEHWETRVGEAEAEAHLIDFATFGAGDGLVPTGWWLRLGDESAGPYREALRNQFIEVWGRSDGIWSRRSVEGAPPPE